MSANIYLERGKGNSFDILADTQVAAIKHSIKNAIDDIADALVQSAREEAPESDPGDSSHPGSLKFHPVDQTTSTFGTVTDISGEAEGFRSVRGPSGRFVQGKGEGAGHLFYKITTTYPDDPYYAKWVARGTGIYGPHHTPIVSPTGKIMKFRYQGRAWRAASVRGQRANPYLERAAEELNVYYVPLKIRELRAQIDAIT